MAAVLMRLHPVFRTSAAPAFLVVCCALGAQRPAAAAELEVVVQDMSGRALAEAVVYLEPSTPLPAPASPGKAVVDQIHKQFVPRVSVIRAGTKVELPNSDNIRHSVYSFSPAKTFTLKLYAGKPANPVVFDKPGVVVLGCNIHDQMIAWVVVVDTPFFARTTGDGKARLADVPAGKYKLMVWHYGAEDGLVEQNIELTQSGSVARTVRIDAESLPLAPAASHGSH